VLEPRNNYPVFAIAHLSLSLVFCILHALIVYIYYMLDIFFSLIDICLGLFAHTYVQPREFLVAPQLLIEKNLEE